MRKDLTATLERFALYGPGDDLDKLSNAHKMVLCKMYLLDQDV